MSQRKLHNPKSHAPAVYIPCWLIQIPQHELSHFAKILYGRLAQWSNAKGYVSRSAPELALELGCISRTVERGLKELRDIKLIETHQVKHGDKNSFIFLDHEFMYRSLQPCLDYYEQHTPPDRTEKLSTDNPLPPDKNVGTPPTDMSVPPDKCVGLKYKEIQQIEKDKSFCATAQKKHTSTATATSTAPSKNKAVWKAENEKRHDFAKSMDNAAKSKQQMDNEEKHIQEHEAIKYAPMPEYLREMIKTRRFAIPAH